jgi:hypothetical protein
MPFRTLPIALVFCALVSTAAFARPMDDRGIAVLRMIDKISARTSTFDVPINKTVQFGSSLFIKVMACRQASPLEQTENAAFLQVWEKKPHDNKSKWIFSGWMFSSNPSLSAMDHPVYDVWVMECKDASIAAKAQEFSSETAPSSKPAKSITAATPSNTVSTGIAADGKTTVDKGTEQDIKQDIEQEEKERAAQKQAAESTEEPAEDETAETQGSESDDTESEAETETAPTTPAPATALPAKPAVPVIPGSFDD